MRTGKLTTSELTETVLNKLKKINPEVLLGAAIGEDCAILKTNPEYNYLLTADPITGASAESGILAVEICCNDIAASGGNPIAVMLTVMVPPNTSLDEISKIISDAQNTAEKYGVEIAGGHTEFTDAVTRPVVSAFAVGRVKNLGKTSCSIKPGDKILVTKSLGMEGTYILCNENNFINTSLTEEDKAELTFIKENLSVLKESRLISDYASAMHDITEGGIKTALEEILTAAGLGAQVYIKKLPVMPLTAKICKAMNLNPLEMISSGSMLIFTQNDNYIIKILEQNNIKCTLIGEIVANKTIKFV